MDRRLREGHPDGPPAVRGPEARRGRRPRPSLVLALGLELRRADVGQGTLDWKSLLQTIRQKTRAQYFVAEHDKPSDAIRFARRSMDAVRNWL